MQRCPLSLRIFSSILTGRAKLNRSPAGGPILHGPAGQYAAIDFPHGENQVDVARINFFMEEPLDADG